MEVNMSEKIINPGLVNMRASQCITALNALWTHESNKSSEDSLLVPNSSLCMQVCMTLQG